MDHFKVDFRAFDLNLWVDVNLWSFVEHLGLDHGIDANCWGCVTLRRLRECRRGGHSHTLSS